MQFKVALVVIYYNLIQLSFSQTSYDYIVVGSGPGGGTLAVELAKAGYQTLLIEAGSYQNSKINQIPIMHFNSTEDPLTSWGFDTEHFENDSSKTFYPRASALGGCTVHHAMISLYPNERDFNEMSDITNDLKWLEPNMRNYLRRMEQNFYLSKSPETKSQHGFTGWFPISYLDLSKFINVNSLMLNIIEKIIGNPSIDSNGYRGDQLATDLEGKIFIPTSINPQTFERFDFGGYIKKAASKLNTLDIWTDTFVTKIILDEDKVARGVEYVKGKYVYSASPLSKKSSQVLNKGQVLASKETIVSGGTFNTPQLLMLSGIGPKSELEKFEIKVKVDLPGVGQNMMDRYEVPFIIKYPMVFHALKNCHFRTNDDCYQEYFQNKTGPYIFNGAVSAELFKSQPNLNEPDVLFLNILANFHGYYRGYSKDLNDGRDAFTRLITLGHTNNKGYVNLKSNDPFQTPNINFRYFMDDPKNLDTLVKLIKRERTYFKSFPGNFTELYPGDDVQSDQDIANYIKKIAWGHHACCTAKVGKDADPNAVLDNQFKVRGTKQLRVVDASSLPSLPGYFPSLYLHLISLRVADMMINNN